MQNFWESEQIYRFDESKDGELYSIDTPPPTVSGSLHLGHLFSYTQAEIIARFKRMQGLNVFYPFGFDDNGLPTERLIEAETGYRAKDLAHSDLRQISSSIIGQYESQFRQFFRSLGFSVDWSLEYQTISPETAKISQELFLDLVHAGKAYAKDAPVLWCVECQTSIAQAELGTLEMASSFVYLPFYVGDEALLVATTRPELLYSTVCLFANPQDERYQSYIGKSATVPLYGFSVPIMADEKVNMSTGSGLAMCSTFGDATDALWHSEYTLEYKKSILHNGVVFGEVPYIGGMEIEQARSEIISILTAKGLVAKQEYAVHSVGIHERCGTPIEIIPSRQWYISILDSRESFLSAADEISWHPEYMKHRYTAWVESLKWDWCISRQRFFGIPLPIWYCKKCAKPAFAAKSQLPIDPAHSEPESACTCGCDEFVPETAVFDTWATSSLTPQINERLGLKLAPMSMRTHAHEIIRTWTFYTIVRSLYHTGRMPWKDLMVCGFVLAKKGEKISKSKSNAKLDPKALIAEHSADALRYWTAGARLGTDIYFAQSDLGIAKRFITKLWNAANFAEPFLKGIDLAYQPDYLPVDRYIAERSKQVEMNAASLLNEYEIGSARKVIDDFFWKDFCGIYIEIAKARLYNPGECSQRDHQSAVHALYSTLLSIIKMYGPYVPHVTEAIYQSIYKAHEVQASIHLCTWGKHSGINETYLLFGEALKESIYEIRKYKSEHNLSMGAQMGPYELRVPAEFIDMYAESHSDLVACSKASVISFAI